MSAFKNGGGSKDDESAGDGEVLKVQSEVFPHKPSNVVYGSLADNPYCVTVQSREMSEPTRNQECESHVGSQKYNIRE